MFSADIARASLSPKTSASYFASLFVARNPNRMAWVMTMLSGDRKIIPALAPIFLVDPLVFNYHHPSMFSRDLAGPSFVTKLASAWAFTAILGLN